jgi:hypothetical protein
MLPESPGDWDKCFDYSSNLLSKASLWAEVTFTNDAKHFVNGIV